MQQVYERNESTPLQIVVLGGTGDLSSRKLLPALLDLYIKDKLPKKFTIIGVARRPYSHEEFREFVAEVIREHKHRHSKKKILDFCSHLYYQSGSFDDSALYNDLLVQMQDHDEAFSTCTNKMYYLAVPPQFYGTIFRKLFKHKMNIACDPKNGWARILVEKPFGNDYKSAQKLDAELGSLFSEEQIFRIDHYLAKEAVQNILSFRFANTLLRGVWNKEYVQEMRITMHETIDVENRGSFYDGIGAVRDVGQNHLLQLLALMTMEEPMFFESKHIRTQRLQALKKLKKQSRYTLPTNFVRGQYTGYKNVPGVAKNSKTETYFALRTFSSSRRWKNVPFYISAGKALDKAKVEIDVIFKDVATGPFETKTCTTTNNKITLTISPKQAMHITLNAKAPGLGYQIENRTLTFDCIMGIEEVKNSYEKVLLDCIRGDQTLFTTTEEVLAEWRYINSILDNLETVPLQSYKKGSSGPKHKLEQ